MDKNHRSKWTNEFRSLGKKKGSRQDFIKLYKEMKKSRENYKDDKEHGEGIFIKYEEYLYIYLLQQLE